MLDIWRQGPTDPASLLAFAAGAVSFVAAVLLTRLGRGRAQAGERRSAQSWVGVAVQGLAIALVGGPMIIRGSVLPLANVPRFAAVVVAMSASVALFWWAARTMGRNWAIVARTRADHQLVTTGPFAMVRNPIYVSMAFFMGGFALASGHVAALLVAAPLYVVGTLIRTTEEERLLRAHFGVAYDAYAARVKRFVPGLV